MNTIRHAMAAMLLAAGLVLAGPALADKALGEMVELEPAQVQTLKQLRDEHWPPFQRTRGEYQRQSRALRRAETAGDAVESERLGRETEALLAQMQQLRDAHDDAIRQMLRPDQVAGFEAWLAEREAMVGSSRDSRMLRGGR